MEWIFSIEHIAWAGPLVLLKAFGILAFYVFKAAEIGKAEGQQD